MADEETPAPEPTPDVPADAPLPAAGSIAREVLTVNIEDEMRQSYLDYAMSTIIARALPDVRDGLKPVQRRILMAMHDLNLTPGAQHRKSAKIAGDTSGNYHPHGEAVVYPTMVRMAQDFSLRYPLVDGQGNFGCFTGDTKIKLLDGTDKSFAELSELPADEIFYVYSVNAEGQIVVGEGRHSRITRRAAGLIEVTLDNGERIRCTHDHRFLLRDGQYKQAQDLTPDDSLMPGYFDAVPVKEGLNEYLRVQQPMTGEYEFVHCLADQYNAERALLRLSPALSSVTTKTSIAGTIARQTSSAWDLLSIFTFMLSIWRSFGLTRRSVRRSARVCSSITTKTPRRGKTAVDA